LASRIALSVSLDDYLHIREQKEIKMEDFYQDLLDRFVEVHNDCRKVFMDLPAHALDWEPGAEMNSISVLVIHLTGAERYWVGDVALRDSSDRNREAEFKVRGMTHEQLLARLDEADHYLSTSLERLTLADLEAMRVSSRSNKSFSVGWALLHALEHSALHLGHLQIIRQLWLQKTNGDN
jgi:uncharacterized damage-inducible protein DinB